LSNNPNDPDNDDDGFDKERLPQGRHFREAQQRGSDSFTSFSEGMPSVDKFKILGATGEHHAIKRPKKTVANTPTLKEERPEKPKEQGVMRLPKSSETSFSEGLPSADKFAITDPDSEKVLSLSAFFASNECTLISEHRSDPQTPHGEPEKTDFRSRSLDRLMYLLDRVPWTDRLKVEFSSKPEFKEFCFDEDTYMFSSEFDEEQTVLAFAHQSYHSTNKLLTKLYDDDQPIDKDTFVDLYMWAEVAALITEINVRRELGLWKVAPPKVLCQESDGSLFSVNVEDVLKSKGMKTLHELLFYSILRGSERSRLVDVYERLYDVYQENFATENAVAKKQIENCLSQGIERDCI